MSIARHLIVNADDFGFTVDVNAGIVEAHRNGVVTATTLMANGDAYDDAARLARETPSLDVGCHLVLLQGRSLISGDPLLEKFPELIKALITRRIDPYLELRPQVEKLLACGIHPTHFDTHKHTHVLPPVFAAVVRLAHEFDVPFIRLPFDTGWLPVQGIGSLVSEAAPQGGTPFNRSLRGLPAHRFTERGFVYESTQNAATGLDGIHVPSRLPRNRVAEGGDTAEREPPA